MTGPCRPGRPRRPAAHRVAALVLDDVVGFDLGTVTQVLGAARDADECSLYDIRVCAPGDRSVRSSAGYRVVAEHGLAELAHADTVVAVGVAEGPVLRDGSVDPAVLDALRGAATRSRLMSVCTGAFVLAAAGLLDGRPATTHWAWASRFRRLFPQVLLDPDVLFVDDGDLLTSAGVAAGVDLCLHVVRRDHGSAVANRAARRCVVPAWRHGGQAQFIERPVPSFEASSTTLARDWAMHHLDRSLTVAELAARSGMSVRTFSRKFRVETGTSPVRWVTGQRVELARQLLETTDLPIDVVAGRCGFGTGAALRQQIGTRLGVAPSAYRATFRPAG
jgi:transcriptional regulator GlxA family with amidase domain